MILALGSRCRCHAEMVGTLHGVAVEPVEKIVLQLVIEQPQASPLVRVRVPFGRIVTADVDQVSISMSPAEFRTLPQVGPPTSRTPRRPSRGGRGDDTEERILTSRTRIECRDGLVGTLSHLLADPRTGDLMGFAFPFGVHFQRNIQVGFDQVSDLGSEVLRLRFDMNEIETFPTLRA